jgi:putative flippase GtrA
MIAKIRALIEKYWDILIYLFFGGVTTVANFFVYFPCHHWLHIPAAISNVIAWAVAVALAYVTNKPFVFKSHDWSMKTVGPELTKFVGCRIGSGFLETAIIFITVDCLSWNGIFWKIVTSVMVVVLNYIASKLLVFRKK